MDAIQRYRLGLLIAAAALDSLSDQLLLIGLIWYVLNVSHSAAASGFLIACFEMPAILTGVLAGRAIDRYQTANIFVLEATARTLLLVGIPIFVSLMAGKLLIIYVLAAAIGAFQPLQRLRDVIMVPRLVEQCEIANANRKLVFTTQTTSLLAPVAAGTFVGYIGSMPAMLAAACLAALSAVVVGHFRKLPQDTEAATPQHIPVIESLRIFKSRPALAIVTVMSLIFFFAYGPLESAMPSFIARDVGGGAQGIGLIWTSFGLGSLLGIRFLTKIYERIGPGVALPLIAAFWGVLMIPLASAPTLVVACASFACAAFVWSPYTILERTLIQRLTPPQHLGTFYGLRSSLAVAGTPSGTAVGGALLTFLSPRSVILISGSLCVVAGACGLLSPALRTLSGEQRGDAV